MSDHSQLWWWSGVGVLALVVPGFLALTALLERSGPIRLRHWAEEAGGRIAAVYDSPARFEAFRFLLSIVARVVLLSLVLVLARALSPSLSAGATAGVALLITTVLAAASELTNRALVGRDAERSLRGLTAVYRACLVLLMPTPWPQSGSGPDRL